MFVPSFVLMAMLIAFGSGILGAMLGLGGGVILVPLLIVFLNVPIQVASGASIVAVVATSSVAAVAYVRNEITNMRLGMFLELATTFGAITGAFITSFASEQILSILLGLSMIYAAAVMYMQSKRTGRSFSDVKNDTIAEKLHLGGSYYDSARDEEIEYGVTHTPQTFTISYIAGIISGLLGIGGGAIKVPTMNVVAGIPMKVAAATSNFMIGVTAAASALVYIRHGYCDAFITAPVVLGTLLGAFVGTRLMNRVRGKDLKNVFIIVLVILGLRKIYSGLI